MKAALQARCEQFIMNRDTIKNVFRLNNLFLYPACANLFCSRGKVAEAEKLVYCRQLIQQKTGVFSSFRGQVQMAVACLLSMEENPEEKLEKALHCHALLKKEFMASVYLPMVAMMLTDVEDAEEKVQRGKALYKRIRAEHPFLTSGEDQVFAVLMTLSGKNDDQLMADMESCYTLLKDRGFGGNNYTQSVSHILALTEGMPEMKVTRFADLWEELIRIGLKYGKYYQLSTLAALSQLEGDTRMMAADMMEAYEYLAGQKGYGFFGMDKKGRLMHAAMIVSNLYGENWSKEAVSVSGTLSMIVAQQMAALAAITASTAMAQATSNNP